MNINVETKFNVGDEVWVADYFYDTVYPSKHTFKVSEINIEIDASQLIIYYWVTMDAGDCKTIDKYSESVCFSTYEECTKWCDEHNN